MTLSKITRLILVAGMSFITLCFAVTTSVADDPDACEATALAAKKAAEREARADFWIAVGNCINDRGSGLLGCIRDARDELDEALALAQEQYEARLLVCELVGDGPYDPHMNPRKFSATVDNTYFPLVPGRTLVYKSRTPEGIERVEVTALDETVEIEGIECRPVHDVVTLNGELIEDTIDWYSQHENGDSWYMGEIALNFEDGFIESIDGSWRTGVDGAKAGIIMLGDPEPGDVYRQEFLLNEAEDMARVASLGETVTVHYGTFEDCLVTLEWTPLEPGVFERKFYAPGVGLVLEVNVETGERLELWDIKD